MQSYSDVRKKIEIDVLLYPENPALLLVCEKQWKSDSLWAVLLETACGEYYSNNPTFTIDKSCPHVNSNLG